MEKICISSKTKESLEELAISLNHPKFRGLQIFSWLNKECVTTFEEMTNLPKQLREQLEDNFYISYPTLLQKEKSKDGSVKYLFRFGKEAIIESVLLKSAQGFSVCISTQVGCKMGCVFCASHIGGFVRNLSAGEILSQIYFIQKDIQTNINNIVIMGIGEPLDNYQNTLNFIRLINDKNGQHKSARGITLSTCGLVNKIYDLAAEGLQITLAISLHAPNDIVRQKIMPKVTSKYSIEELLEAARYYFEKTKRRITYEYTLIKNINDQKEHAHELGRRLKGTPSHINLVELNAIKKLSFEKSGNTNHFAKILKSYNIETTIRKSQGSDVSAACGQLVNREFVE